MHAKKSHTLLGATACLLLAACGSEDDSRQCDVENLLVDPGFTTFSLPRKERKWFISEHAAVRSFAYKLEDGTLTITKTGGEPWALVSQSVDDPTFGGRTVRYSADIHLDMQPPEPMHGFKQGGGLSLVARVNGNFATNSILEHEPHMGSSDWTRVSVEMKLPAKTDSVQAGILHQANGELSVRKPTLVFADCDD